MSAYQFPVVRNTGPVVLRTDRSILLGVRGICSNALIKSHRDHFGALVDSGIRKGADDASSDAGCVTSTDVHLVVGLERCRRPVVRGRRPFRNHQRFDTLLLPKLATQI